MIRFQDIQIKYGNFTAIDKLNLTIQKGEFFTFLGPSGCGKTTTLRALVGFLNPSAGNIYIGDKDITHVPVEKRKIGIVFQSYALFPTMNVYDNIAYGLKVRKLSKGEIEEKVRAVAKKIDLNEEQLFKSVADLSGGQQQRVALARAIVLEPEILCLDEPLSNLDAKLRVGLRGELKRLQQDLGITTLYVTHDQEEALTLSDRIAVFNKGCVEQVGTPYEIYNCSSSEFVCDFIGDINRLDGNVMAEINRQTGKHFDENKTGFVRIERLNVRPMEACDVTFKGRIIEREYSGVCTKYTFDVGGDRVKCIEKNDGSTYFEKGEERALYLNSNDIMQF